MWKKKFTRKLVGFVFNLFVIIKCKPHNWINLFSNYSLIVENVGIEDDGVYVITASNSVGETVASAKLVCHSKLDCKSY